MYSKLGRSSPVDVHVDELGKVLCWWKHEFGEYNVEQDFIVVY